MVQGLWISYKFYRKVISSNVNNYNQIPNTKNLKSLLFYHIRRHNGIQQGEGGGRTGPLQTRSKGTNSTMHSNVYPWSRMFKSYNPVSRYWKIFAKTQ